MYIVMVSLKDLSWAIYEIRENQDDFWLAFVIDASNPGVDFGTADWDLCWDDEFITPADKLFRIRYEDNDVLGVFDDLRTAQEITETLEGARIKATKAIHEAKMAFKIAQTRHQTAVKNAQTEFSVMAELFRKPVQFPE